MSVLFVDGLEYVLFRGIKTLSQSCHPQDMYLKRSTTPRVATKQTPCRQTSEGVRLNVKPLTPPSGAVENSPSVSATQIVLEEL